MSSLSSVKSATNDLSKLYAPQGTSCQDRTTLVGQALGHLADVWEVLQELETDLPEDMSRWDAESLVTARKGTQRAWLALSNLRRSLDKKR